MNKEKNNQNLLITGGLLSIAGDSLFSTAVMYYLSQVKEAAFYLSLATLLLTIPSVFATLIGVFTDRSSPKKVMIMARLAQAILCLGLMWSFKSIPQLLVIIFLLEMFATVNSVAGLSLTSRIISPEKRSKIIGMLHAIQSSLKLGGRFFGAALFIIIHPLGVAVANACTFFLDLLCIVGIHLPVKTEESKTSKAKRSSIKEWVEGWQALHHDRLTARLSWGVAIIGATTLPIGAFLSLILVSRLHANTFEFGFAYAVEMLGGIMGGLFCSALIKRIVARFGYGIMFLFNFLIMGLSTLVLGIASHYWMVVVALFLLGLVQSFQNITAPTYFMLVNSHEVLGRVIGIVTSLQAGSGLMASLCLTFISTRVSVMWILVVAGGITCMATVALFAFPIGVLKTKVQAEAAGEQA